MCSSIIIIIIIIQLLKLGFSAALIVHVEPQDGRVPVAMSRLLLVGLLFVGVPRSVLDVGRTGAQPVQVATVFRIINMILKEHLWGQTKTWSSFFGPFHFAL